MMRLAFALLITMTSCSVPVLPWRRAHVHDEATTAATRHDVARSLVSRATRALADAESLVSATRADTSANALTTAPTRADYAERMKPLDDAMSAIRASRVDLLGAMTSVDVWESTGGRAWSGIAPCLAVSFARLRDAMASAGVTPPSSIDRALDAAEPWRDDECAAYAATCEPEGEPE